MELCRGTLKDVINGTYYNGEQEIENLSDKRKILWQVTEALAHLHSLGIVHRDIKPNNILISIPVGTVKAAVKLADFGLSKMIKLDAMDYSNSASETAPGNRCWMAPELLENEDTYTKAVDIFALGLIFGFTLTGGKHPFGDISITLRRRNISNEHFEISSEYLKGTDFLSAHQFIVSMLQYEPSKRPLIDQVLVDNFFSKSSYFLDFSSNQSSTASGAINHFDHVCSFFKTTKQHNKTYKDDTFFSE